MSFSVKRTACQFNRPTCENFIQRIIFPNWIPNDIYCCFIIHLLNCDPVVYPSSELLKYSLNFGLFDLFYICPLYDVLLYRRVIHFFLVNSFLTLSIQSIWVNIIYKKNFDFLLTHYHSNAHSKLISYQHWQKIFLNGKKSSSYEAICCMHCKSMYYIQFGWSTRSTCMTWHDQADLLLNYT